jgi:glycosyltransferase involved in cell wall biosynthesis
MRVLVVTKIFPNALEPLSSPFNRQQFAALGRQCEVEVLATIPWFPGARALGRWSAAGRLTAVPAREVIDGLEVRHPRFLYLPKLARGAAGPLYAASLLAPLFSRRRRFDVLLGSWAYPDGFAAVALGRLLALPAVVKLHGSDVNVVAAMAGPRRRLAWALPRARRVVAVSRALADAAVELGARRERVAVVENGVDPALFHPADRAAARAELGRAPGERLILYIGRLEREKGALDLLAAFAPLAARRPELTLALVGDGSQRAACEREAHRIGRQVVLAGARPLAEVPRWIAAADVVALPSWNEGSPNVLLEAQACGRPIVATRVGGIPDLVGDASLGELVAPRAVAELEGALERVCDGAAAGRYPEAAIVARARGGWDESAARLKRELERAVAEHAAGGGR